MNLLSRESIANACGAVTAMPFDSPLIMLLISAAGSGMASQPSLPAWARTGFQLTPEIEAGACFSSHWAPTAETRKPAAVRPGA